MKQINIFMVIKLLKVLSLWPAFVLIFCCIWQSTLMPHTFSSTWRIGALNNDMYPWKWSLSELPDSDCLLNCIEYSSEATRDADLLVAGHLNHLSLINHFVLIYPTTDFSSLVCSTRLLKHTLLLSFNETCRVQFHEWA